jgi:DNA mismatch repair protein MutL
MPEVHELDAQTVERIAAGEVVERPASAVKELVENSIDADADRVDVAVESGGTEGIRVSDDGVGMDEQTLRRAVEKHTTSKIADITDLESGVGTLGFRGEALHAIGAVSRLTITTRPREGGQGTELTVEGGDVTGVSPAGCPAGTTVEVRDLFYNVPARRKYLKQESTEFAHVNTVVTSYALANPDVAVSLTHDGRETFATTGSDDLRETVLAVYGREVAESMVPVEAEIPEGPLDGVSGLVSHPETNRATRDYLSTFVNGRYVTAGTVRDAVVDAYGAQLGPDRYPFAVLSLALDPASVDVNVHPRKLEVRFADAAGVREQVETAVEESLLAAGLLRSSAPRGQSAPEQTEIRPGDDSEETRESEHGTAGTSDSTPDSGTRDSESTASTGEETATSDSTGTEESERERPATPDERVPADATETGATATDTETETTEREYAQATHGSLSGHDSTGKREHARKFDPGSEQARLGDAEGLTLDQLPAMRVLGQVWETYIAAETDDGLVLVDQHAADERINYERLRESFAGETTTQALAEPVRLELTAHEAELFDSHADALARLGFRAALVEDRTVEVSTVPALVAEAAGPELVRDVLAEFVKGEAAAADTVEAAADELLADLACHPSITGNTSLTDGSVLDLLSTLDDCENPWACPHGRPVIVEFDSDEIEARFERDYPGHG